VWGEVRAGFTATGTGGDRSRAAPGGSIALSLHRPIALSLHRGVSMDAVPRHPRAPAAAIQRMRLHDSVLGPSAAVSGGSGGSDGPGGRRCACSSKLGALGPLGRQSASVADLLCTRANGPAHRSPRAFVRRLAHAVGQHFPFPLSPFLPFPVSRSLRKPPQHARCSSPTRPWRPALALKRRRGRCVGCLWHWEKAVDNGNGNGMGIGIGYLALKGRSGRPLGWFTRARWILCPA
jgi:hypothetical protein